MSYTILSLHIQIETAVTRCYTFFTLTIKFANGMFTTLSIDELNTEIASETALFYPSILFIWSGQESI
jgi:hypothetical protein